MHLMHGYDITVILIEGKRKCNIFELDVGISCLPPCLEGRNLTC